MSFFLRKCTIERDLLLVRYKKYPEIIKKKDTFDNERIIVQIEYPSVKAQCDNNTPMANNPLNP